MRFTSVNSKLVLMTLGGMAFTLLLMAGMLNFSILDHHKQLAAQQTQKHLAIVQNEIKSLQLKMQEKANRIAAKTEVIASLSLLNNYQGQFSQESVMFEQEKQKLRVIIYDEVQNSHLDGGGLFDHQDQLLAFVESRQDSVFSGIQVKAGHDWLLKNELNQPLSEFNQSIMSELNQFLNHQAIKDREPATRAHLHGSELHLEFYHPIYRTYPGGNKAWQGTVVLKKYLNANYFQQINVDRLVNTIIVNSQGQAISNNQVFDKQLPKLQRAHLQSIVDQKSLGQTDQTFFSVEPFDLDAAGSDFVFIVSTYPLSEYHHQVKQARLSMLWAGLISFLAALPIVYWYSRKSFQKPLNTIKQTTRAYEAGDYQASIEINSQDEFTEVAHAMQNMARKVEEREDELQTLIKHLPVIVFAKEAQHLSFTQFNATAENILGLKRDDLIGKNDFDLFPFEQAQSFVKKDREVLKQGRVLDIPLEAIQTPNGLKWLHTRKVPVCDRNGKPLYLLGVSLDITQELAQQKEQQRWDIIFENMSEAIILTDHNGIIQRVNTAFETITGYLADEVIGERPSKIKSGKHDILFYENLWSQLLRTGKWSGEIWNRTKAGDEFPVWESIAAIYDEEGAFLNYVGIFSDIGEIKASREEIDFLAYHDALTGLPNRIHFNEHLKHAIADAKRNKRILAVCFIDLDRFKNINDSLGHQVGDELLKSISQKLTSLIRETDVLSRQGGDEFLLLLENIPGRESVKTVLKKITSLFETPFEIENHSMHVSLSIGVAIFPEDGMTETLLIRNADSAMYKAKEAGRKRIMFYSSEMTEEACQRSKIEQFLLQALERNEFEFYYQPQVNLKTQKVSAEALIRWNHPEMGLIMPDAFIQIAEEIGIMPEIGQWGLQAACRQLKAWQNKGLAIERIAVNLSPAQLCHKGLILQIKNALSTYGLSPKSLDLEITEAVFTGEIDALSKVLQQISDLGVSLSLDDFGTGFSSLQYLNAFPIDRIKIDKAFIQNSHANQEAFTIAKSTIAMAHKLNMLTVAEGVELVEHIELLKAEGCEEVQGYYFSKPLKAERFENWMNKFSFNL